MSAPEIAPSSPAAAPNVPDGPKKKETYFLYDPSSLKPLARMQSRNGWRYAALKVASKLHKFPESLRDEEDPALSRIWLRKSNTREVREYLGKVEDIPPQTIVRQGREITFKRRPVVKYTGKRWQWKGNKNEEEEANAAAEI